MQTNSEMVTLLDGGMGQELLRRSGQTPHPLWSTQVMIDYPDIVHGLHVDFINAGAQVITLNAYTLTPERLSRDGDVSDFDRLQQLAIEIAHNARAQAGLQSTKIAGCLPPLVGSYRPDQAPDADVMLNTYRQIVAAQSGHVDLFICETMASIKEATAAATAAKESGLPVWVSMTVEDDQAGLLRSGEALADAVVQLDALNIDAKLMNCSKPEAISSSWSALSSGKPGLLGAYANGFTSISALEPGGTVDVLSARHDLGPDNYAAFAMEWVEKGARIVGGCCEVGPEHIAAIATKLKSGGYLQ